MTNSKILFRLLVEQLSSFERSEAEAIIYRLIEHTFGLKQNDVWKEREVEAIPEDFTTSIQRINKHEPIQYILNEEEFYGRKFYVDPSVLIPRPETEELVRNCIALLTPNKIGFKIVDVGTGSGCIAITLSLELKEAQIFATDISEAALQVAERNGRSLKANVNFLKHDILNNDLPFEDLDMIVSNPPYISGQERKSMLPNVLKYEPHSALFTGDDDVLIFYKTIARLASVKLKSGGYVAVEINEHFGKETAALFTAYYFEQIKIINDMNEKQRFIFARKK